MQTRQRDLRTESRGAGVRRAVPTRGSARRDAGRGADRRRDHGLIAAARRGRGHSRSSSRRRKTPRSTARARSASAVASASRRRTPAATSARRSTQLVSDKEIDTASKIDDPWGTPYKIHCGDGRDHRALAGQRQEGGHARRHLDASPKEGPQQLMHASAARIPAVTRRRGERAGHAGRGADDDRAHRLVTTAWSIGSGASANARLQARGDDDRRRGPHRLRARQRDLEAEAPGRSTSTTRTVRSRRPATRCSMLARTTRPAAPPRRPSAEKSRRIEERRASQGAAARRAPRFQPVKAIGFDDPDTSGRARRSSRASSSARSRPGTPTDAQNVGPRVPLLLAGRADRARRDPAHDRRRGRRRRRRHHAPDRRRSPARRDARGGASRIDAAARRRRRSPSGRTRAF